MGEQQFVEFRGRRMVAGWPERIVAAQRIIQLEIGGVLLGRIRFGEEQDDRAAEGQPCTDCRVERGEFHVPGCDAEECPNCHEQLITCECDAADIEPEEQS